jgi:hypothetical protein
MFTLRPEYEHRLVSYKGVDTHHTIRHHCRVLLVLSVSTAAYIMYLLKHGPAECSVSFDVQNQAAIHRLLEEWEASGWVDPWSGAITTGVLSLLWLLGCVHSAAASWLLWTTP